jgi:hypothetical protein
MFTWRASTPVAIFIIAFGVLGVAVLLAGGPMTAETIWGFIFAFFITALLGVTSFKRSRKKLTKKQIHNVAATAGSLRYYTLWLGIGSVAYVVTKIRFQADQPPDFLLGSFFGFCLFMGAMILLDNYWLKRIFIWNSKDPRVKRIIGKKL